MTSLLLDGFLLCILFAYYVKYLLLIRCMCLFVGIYYARAWIRLLSIVNCEPLKESCSMPRHAVHAAFIIQSSYVHTHHINSLLFFICLLFVCKVVACSFCLVFAVFSIYIFFSALPLSFYSTLFSMFRCIFFFLQKPNKVNVLRFCLKYKSGLKLIPNSLATEIRSNKRNKIQ